MSNKKYHIKKDGTPGECFARRGCCPLSPEGEHFTTKEDAMKFAEKSNEIWSDYENKFGNRFIITREDLEDYGISDEELDRAKIKENVKYALVNNENIGYTAEHYLFRNVYGFSERLESDFGEDCLENDLLVETFEETLKDVVPKFQYRGETIYGDELTPHIVEKIKSKTRSNYITKVARDIEIKKFDYDNILTAFGVSSVNELYNKNKKSINSYDVEMEIEWVKDYNDDKPMVRIKDIPKNKKYIISLDLEDFKHKG